MIKKITTILLLVMSVFATTASADNCTNMEAYAAETVTGYLDSWENVKKAYEQFRHCDDGAIAEGFDEAISLLWENQWDKLPEMLKYTSENKGFKVFIYKRIWSETVPEERWQTILKKSQMECPKGGEEFCSEIIRSGKAALNIPVEQSR